MFMAGCIYHGRAIALCFAHLLGGHGECLPSMPILIRQVGKYSFTPFFQKEHLKGKMGWKYVSETWMQLAFLCVARTAWYSDA